MNLEDFVTKKSATTLTSVPVKATGSLADFVGKSSSLNGVPVNSTLLKTITGGETASLPRNVDEARKLQEDNPTLWDKVIKNLSKPIGTVATLAEESGRVLGDVAYGIQSGDFSGTGQDILNIPKKIGGIWTGTRTRSFGEVFKEHWDPVRMDDKGGTDVAANFWNDGVPQILGLITDIAADPLNFIGGGLTNKGKVIEKVSKLKAAGEIIKADSKLAKQMKVLGITEDMLEMGTTKADQVRKGQRALLTLFGNTRWEKNLVGGERVYDLIDTGVTGFKQTKLANMIKEIFSTKTDNEGFNLVKEHYTNLLDYRQGQVMDEAVSIQNDLAKLSPDEAKRVIDVIETGVQSGDEVIDLAAKRLNLNFKEIRKTEEGLGLLKTDIENYFPHQLVKEGTEKLSAWQKFKNLFTQADGTFDDIGKQTGDARVWNTKLDSSLARDYQGTLSEIRNNFGITFDDRPAIVYAKRALGSAKAVTSKEFYTSTRQFALNNTDDILQIVKNSEAFDVERAISNGDIARESVFKNGDILTDYFAKGRIDDIAQKLTEFNPTAGDVFRQAVAGKANTMKSLVKTAEEIIQKFSDDVPGVTVKAKELKGLKFPADIARQIDQYHEAVKPESLNKFLKTFDQIQNWWKAQALTAPSYHVRNMAGNTWNNFLAGVVDPQDYFQAAKLQGGGLIDFTDDAGRVWDNKTILDAAKKTGVINEGWYAKDIETALTSNLDSSTINPLKQNFGLFKANRKMGSALENNARLAHFISKIKEGMTIDDAALSVKKYLFDYGDLTSMEKNVFKRVVPFYTWTRKNIPLQVEKLFTNPAKFAAIGKITNAIESNVDKPNEKYLGDYIKNNIGVRVGTDKEGNTHYFLLGNWLPSAQAIDFLSQPVENMLMMVTPFIKAPIETWSNQSWMFENTFGEPAKIERYPQENQSWLGLTMRKKTVNILKNIRILNELDKLNPGSIFGDEDSPSLINRVAPEAGFKAPFGIGYITTSNKRGGRFTPEGTQADRIIQSMFGKDSLYNPNFAKKFYLWDTETKIRELEKARKDAIRDGQKEYAKRLGEELKSVKRNRK